MKARPLDRRVIIETPISIPDPDFGTAIITWTLLAVIWANVLDEPPSQNEALKQQVVVAKNRVNVRYRYRTDVNSAMRIIVRGPVDRVLQIVGGPAEIGQHEFSEVTCEQYSS